MSRQIQKLIRHGNCTVVTITRPLLFVLNWLPGQNVICELLEDRTGVVFRLPRPDDFGAMVPPRLNRTGPPHDAKPLPLYEPATRRPRDEFERYPTGTAGHSAPKDPPA